MVIRKRIAQNQEEGKSRCPLTAVKRMVTTLRKLNMEHLKFHVILESGKKMERTGINESDGANKRSRKLCGVSCTLKKRGEKL